MNYLFNSTLVIGLAMPLFWNSKHAEYFNKAASITVIIFLVFWVLGILWLHITKEVPKHDKPMPLILKYIFRVLIICSLIATGHYILAPFYFFIPEVFKATYEMNDKEMKDKGAIK